MRYQQEHMKKADLNSMLDNHLNLTLSEAVATLGKYSNSIIAFDKIYPQAMIMSDSLADGIVKQFPNKFSRTSIITTSSSFLTTTKEGLDSKS